MFNETRNKFDKLLKDALGGDYENLFTSEDSRNIVSDFVNIGKEKVDSFSVICDANILASYIFTILIGDLLHSLAVPEETIPAIIEMFMETYPDDIFMILGCLSFASDRKLTFEGKNITKPFQESQ